MSDKYELLVSVLPLSGDARRPTYSDLRMEKQHTTAYLRPAPGALDATHSAASSRAHRPYWGTNNR